jgi:hypothetical protein
MIYQYRIKVYQVFIEIPTIIPYRQNQPYRVLRLRMANVTEVKAELLPVKNFAARLGVSVWTARGWCYRGTVASVKIGSKLLVPVGEVDRVISENIRPRVEQN